MACLQIDVIELLERVTRAAKDANDDVGLQGRRERVELNLNIFAFLHLVMEDF